MYDRSLRVDLLKSERVGKGVVTRIDEEEGRSSPKRHWPQKAVVAQAAITASSGELRSRCSTSCKSIVALIGGRGGRLEPRGARLCTPLRT